MSDRLVYPRVVTLGKAAPEEVQPARMKLHAWLMERVTGEPTRLIPFDRTIYVPSTEIGNCDDVISRWLKHSAVDHADDKSTLVIDLTTNLYGSLPDPLAQDTAAFVATWVERHHRRTAAILMPEFPARNVSLFWKPLADNVSQRIVVFANNGKRWSGGKFCDPADELGSEYAERLGGLNDPDQTEVRERILKELGHYSVLDEGQTYCARYFFDASLVVAEVSRLLAAKVSALGLHDDRICLLTHGANSDWLHRAGLHAGGRLAGKVPSLDITNPDAVADLRLQDYIAVPIFDVVNSGNTCSRVVRWLLDQGVRISEKVFAVMVDRDARSPTLPSDHSLEGLFTVAVDKRRQVDCPQCKYLLPYTKPLSATLCRPFDMWHVLLEYPWKPEPYWPEGVAPFMEAPDMGAIFDGFGGWIAHRVAMLLRDEVRDKDVVFVSPQELDIGKLTRWLSPRFHERIVAIQIPRPLLNSVAAGADPRKQVAGSWRVQLEHVANAPHRSVVVIDEFNASNTTARALMATLRAFDVEPNVYLPILNRAVGDPLSLPVDLRSLYQIPSPRKPRHSNGVAAS